MVARTAGRRWWVALLLVLVVLGPAALGVEAPTAAAQSDGAYKLADKSDRPVGRPHETFFSTDATVQYAAGQTVRLAGDPTGTGVITVGDYSGNVYVDDAMDITVEHPDGSLQNWSNEWTFWCGGIFPSSPIDLSGLFRPGTNLVRVSLRDECGSHEGSSALYLIGSAKAAAGPGDSPTAATTFGAEWRYTTRSTGQGTAFAEPAFDDSSWSRDNLPLDVYDPVAGSSPDCPLLYDEFGTSTTATAGSEVAARAHVSIPTGATHVVVSAVVSGKATVLWNGRKLSTVASDCQRIVSIPVPDDGVSTDDVLAFSADVSTTGRYGFQVSYLPAGVTNHPSGLGLDVLPVTSTTPLYTVPVSVRLPAVTCPARLDLSLGAASEKLVRKTVPVCGKSGSAPASLDVDVPVFDPETKVGAQPSSRVDIAASLTGGATASVSTQLPRAPVWVGVGDSYTSGHHQDHHALDLHCNLPLLAGVSLTYLKDTCHTYPDDPGFSWVTKAVSKLNHDRRVPTAWRMSTVVAGLSGASTSEYGDAAGSQIDVMKTYLHERAGSWNVVSTTGGADDGDFTFASALHDWYAARKGSKHLAWSKAAPWKAKWPDCPDTEHIGRTVEAEKAHIVANLTAVYATADTVGPGTRFVDVDYPYVLPDKKGSCSRDYVTKQGELKRGATSVIDLLDSYHRGLDRPGLTVVDLRGRIAFKDIQHTLLLGYPHVTKKGQAVIADQALRQLHEDLQAW